MRKQYLSISLLLVTTAILISGIFESKAFALTQDEQRNLIGFAIGCKDGLAGKNPDPTQYDKAHGLSTHSVSYNIGYIEGFNSCSANIKIG
jgi:hypothetical protein